jgi:hypothetical protein
MDFRRHYSPLILPGTAIFALLWAIARACVQSITIDEADTYLVWVARHDPSHWQGASNNHILNSLLMRLFTSVFGVSHLSVRTPALLGAALYIGAAYLLCRKLALAWYNHNYGVRDVASNWMYGSSLNFYRVQSGGESFGEIESPLQIPGDRSLYVLCYPFDEDFIKRHRLRVVYHAPNTDAVVAVRPEAEAEWGRRAAKAAIPIN